MAGGRRSGSVALLRGMNVGGVTLPMPRLKELGEEAGLHSVRTYIASGNLIFASDEGEDAIRARLEQLIERELGRRIGVRVWADRYLWRFGDGTARSTSSAGAAYPDLEVTHRYLRKGLVRPSLATRYIAQFRLGGGAWTAVPGSATIPTPAQRLRVVTATPVLTGS